PRNHGRHSSAALRSAKVDWLRGCRPVQTSNPNGANRDRTGDLLLAKQALSQLSYGPRSPILGRSWALRTFRAEPMETLWKRRGLVLALQPRTTTLGTSGSAG